MKKLEFSDSYGVKQALITALAVLISACCTRYFSFSGEYWLVLSTFLVSQTTRGTPLRQAIYTLLIMMISILLAAIIKRFSPSLPISFGIVTTTITLSGLWLFYQRPNVAVTYYHLLFFNLVLLLATFHANAPSTHIFYDILFGTIIAIVISLVLFPNRLVNEFRNKLVVLLRSLRNYTQQLTLAFSHPAAHLHSLAQARRELDNVSQDYSGHYPEWVFASGFNPGLRSGFRYFLVQLDRVSELLYSLNYYLQQPLAPNVLNAIYEPLNEAMQKNAELLQQIIDYMSHKKISVPASDLTTDMIQLEKALQSVVPGSIELLDVSGDYVTLTAVVRDIKDFRGLLLQLITALPNASSR